MDFVSKKNLEKFMMNQSNNVLLKIEIEKLKKEIKYLEGKIENQKKYINKMELNEKLRIRKTRTTRKK